MKKFLVFIAIGIILFSESTFAKGKHNIQLSLGSFVPNGNAYDDSDWNSEGDVSLSYIYQAFNFVAFEVSLHGYSTEVTDISSYSVVDTNFDSGGIEFLVRVQKKFNSLLPYFGIGFGSYSNDVEINLNGSELIDDNEQGTGIVAKTGINYMFNNGFYIGFEWKVITNNQEVEIYDGYTYKAYKYDGGSAFSLNLGYNF